LSTGKLQGKGPQLSTITKKLEYKKHYLYVGHEKIGALRDNRKRPNWRKQTCINSVSAEAGETLVPLPMELMQYAQISARPKDGSQRLAVGELTANQAKDWPNAEY
jgi:hypothetical protein